jgi:hypothetical protein
MVRLSRVYARVCCSGLVQVFDWYVDDGVSRGHLHSVEEADEAEYLSVAALSAK